MYGFVKTRPKIIEMILVFLGIVYLVVRFLFKLIIAIVCEIPRFIKRKKRVRVRVR